MSIVKLQQTYADLVLAKVSKIDKSVIIAGGAPRDWYLGLEATDLDVYFHPNPSWDTITTYRTLQDIGFTFDGYRDFSEAGIAYGKLPQLKAIFEPTDTPMKVQLMCMSEPVQDCVLQSFAIDLSLVSYKYEKIIPTPEFLEALKTKTITRVNPDYSDFDPYIMKILGKFPNLKYNYGNSAPQEDTVEIPF